MSGVWKATGWAVTIVAVLLALGLVAWVSVPRFLDLHGFVVLSGSMKPALPVGSVAFVRQAEAETIEVGDVLTFYHPESRSPVLVTHRVIEVVRDERLGRAFRTQGDANDIPDEWLVPNGNVYGTVEHVVPYMGHITAAIQGRTGFLLLMGVPGAVIIIGELRNIWREVVVSRRKGPAT
jgi:signal peptidase